MKEFLPGDIVMTKQNLLPKEVLEDLTPNEIYVYQRTPHMLGSIIGKLPGDVELYAVHHGLLGVAAYTPRELEIYE